MPRDGQGNRIREGIYEVTNQPVPAGPASLPARQVALDTQRIVFWMERAGTPSGPLLSVTIEGSADGGTVWRQLCGATIDGGDVIGKDGNVLARSELSIEYEKPLDEKVRYQIRLAAQVAQPFLLTGGMAVE